MRTSLLAFAFALAPVVTWAQATSPDATDSLKLGDITVTGSLECRANRRMTFTAYLGYTQGLASMEEIYPKDKDGRFGYIELLYKF